MSVYEGATQNDIFMLVLAVVAVFLFFIVIPSVSEESRPYYKMRFFGSSSTRAQLRMTGAVRQVSATQNDSPIIK